MEIIFLRVETEQSHAGRTDLGTGCELPGQEKGDRGEDPLAGIESQHPVLRPGALGGLGKCYLRSPGSQDRACARFQFESESLLSGTRSVGGGEDTCSHSAHSCRAATPRHPLRAGRDPSLCLVLTAHCTRSPQYARRTAPHSVLTPACEDPHLTSEQSEVPSGLPKATEITTDLGLKLSSV